MYNYNPDDLRVACKYVSNIADPAYIYNMDILIIADMVRDITRDYSRYYQLAVAAINANKYMEV